jgi:hypothetical protein
MTNDDGGQSQFLRGVGGAARRSRNERRATAILAVLGHGRDARGSAPESRVARQAPFAFLRGTSNPNLNLFIARQR